MKGIIVQDDARYSYTKQYLQNKGYFFHASDTAKDADFVIFPFKQKVDEAVYDENFFSTLNDKALVFSGLQSDYLSEKCAKHTIKYYVMMDDMGVKVKNSVPTSEGVIAYLINGLSCTIANSSILVIGYGTCGRDLALRLHKLDANVSALVRSREKECAAYADSITPVYAGSPLNFDAIVNTVPDCVLTDKMLMHTNGALLIDIASEPYGFNMGLAKTINSKSALLPGLPGKCAPQTAGEVLGEYIDFILKGGIPK